MSTDPSPTPGDESGPPKQPYPFKTFKARHKGLMSKSKRTGEMRFTKRGLLELERCLNADATLEETADYFCAPAAEIKRLLDVDGQGHNIARRCKADVRITLREKQFGLASENATIASFLGKQILGQRDEQHIVSENETTVRHVIGAMPDYKLTPEQWQKQFAPDVVTDVSTIEQLKQLQHDKKEKVDAVDAGQ